MEQVLHGIRVLDLSEGIAGPAAAKFLADFGAEVIKIEPPVGDWARQRGPFPGDRPDIEASALFANYNRNKLGVTLDVFHPRGRAILDRLVADADILISSYTPRQFEELRLDYELLKGINPGIVVLAITPWGLTGPYRDYQWSELVLDAFGHSMAAFGVKDREPLTMGGGLRQHYAGRFGALAALAAQMTAERSGTGRTIDLSMIEVQLGSADRRSPQLMRWQYIRRLYYRQDSGISAGNLRGGYQLCGDGWLHVALQPGDFARLAPLIGRAEWLEDPRFTPIEQKWPSPALHNELSAAFLEWSLQYTREEIEDLVRPLRLPIYAVNHYSDVLKDRHLAAREFWVEETHLVTGANRYTGAPFKLERGGYRQTRPAPLLGQHNGDVFGGRFAISADELRELEALGVIAQSDAATRLGSVAPASPAPPRPSHAASSAPRLPLEGIRVLDMTAIWSGPAATMVLGDLGADVIRVESLQFSPLTTRGGILQPSSYDELEKHPNPYFSSYVDFYPGTRPWNRFGGFNFAGRNKRSMTADLRRPEGVQIFKKVVAQSDVVLDNYAFGVMDRLGLGYSALAEVNPRIIVISMPLYGNSGPQKAAVGAGSVVDAWSGFMAMRGYRDFDLGGSQATFHMDGATGPGACLAILGAIRERERSGRGQFIDFSQSENMIQGAGEYFLDCQWNHRDPEHLGNRDRWGAVQGCYPCTGTDQWVVLTIETNDEWQALGRVLGNPAWVADARFSTPEQRRQHHDEIDRLISEWSRTIDASEAMHALQAVGIPAARVLNERDAFADPHIAAREFFIQTWQADCGTHLYPGHQWKPLGTPLRAERPSPLLGEDNEAIYKGMLGYSDADYQRLIDQQHIGWGYLPGLKNGR